jgi:hypothetical protein
MYPRDVDDREFNDPDEERCPSCGVGPLDWCIPDCECKHCDGGESLDGDALRGQEARSESIDQQIEWQRLK